jgi:hypothetical protein
MNNTEKAVRDWPIQYLNIGEFWSFLTSSLCSREVLVVYLSLMPLLYTNYSEVQKYYFTCRFAYYDISGKTFLQTRISDTAVF